MEYKIEKNVDLPSGGKAKSGRMAALRAMEIGDSVFVPVDSKAKYASSSHQSNWSNDAKVVGRKVATRTVEGGIRVWRIA